MGLLSSENLKEEKVVSTPFRSISGAGRRVVKNDVEQ